MVKAIMIILGLAVVAAASGFSGVYLISEARLHHVARGPVFDHAIPLDSASIEKGRHIARTRGCFGCHGQQLEGKDFSEQWDWPERAVAPNLAAYAQINDAAVIEAAIRQGIDRNGKALTSMPSFNFTRLTDEDTAALIAFLQTAPVVEKKLPRPNLGWSARWDFARGKETHMAQWVALTPALKVDAVREPQRARGEYMAMTMCNECHGLDVRGSTIYGRTPDLAVAAAYSREEFEALIEAGAAPGGRKLGLMSLVGPDRFPDLSETEIDDLYAYLTSLVDEPVSENVPWRSVN